MRALIAFLLRDLPKEPLKIFPFFVFLSPLPMNNILFDAASIVSEWKLTKCAFKKTSPLGSLNHIQSVNSPLHRERGTEIVLVQVTCIIEFNSHHPSLPNYRDGEA